MKKIIHKPNIDYGNVLVLSISQKVPLLESVKKTISILGGGLSLYGGDKNFDCVGKYFVDKFWQMPSLDDLLISDLILYCKKNNINTIIPTRDGELLYFARYKEQLAKEKISIIISDGDVIKLCLDKLSFYEDTLHFNMPIIKTVLAIETLESERYVVKERFGAGSKSIGINLSKEEAVKFARNLEAPIFQPFVIGEEASVDIYVSRDNITKGIVMRMRNVVVDGESKVTTTFKDEKLMKLSKKFVRLGKFYGHIILQVLKDNTDDYHIIECNPRFGGASTLSIAAGLETFYWSILEANGVDIKDYSFLNKEVQLKQIRYSKDEILLMK